jgi:hypothetical protein
VAEADRKEGEKKIRLQEDEENRLAELSNRNNSEGTSAETSVVSTSLDQHLNKAQVLVVVL